MCIKSGNESMMFASFHALLDDSTKVQFNLYRLSCLKSVTVWSSNQWIIYTKSQFQVFSEVKEKNILNLEAQIF